ncbi:MAG TPA: hypothetical protein VEV41_17945 [Terriglobales bacterium]|nr:hypothetical protein [Terriglobales bacterium]
MKTNQRMEALYEEVRAENLDDPKALPQKLLAVLNAGFLEQEQCVFLSPLRKTVQVQRLDFSNSTGYECFVNHLHVEDFLENGGLPPLEMLGRGLAFAQELKERLAALPGSRHFRIIVGFNGSSCTVRFHTLRHAEEWLEKDADTAADATAIIDT